MPSTIELVKYFRITLAKTEVCVTSPRRGEIAIRSTRYPDRCYVTTRAVAGANIEAFAAECLKAHEAISADCVLS